MPLLSEKLDSRFRFVTLAQFRRELPDDLVVLHDADEGHAGDGQDADHGVLLRWVEPSELEDPTPYLMDGEFILTAGLPFVGDGGRPELVDAYVARLVESKVCALGFGLTPYHDAVPQPLIDSCRQRNLTLIQVPPSVPFAAIGLQFAQLLESEGAKVFRQLADANRVLMRGVLSPRPEHELLQALVQRFPCWAVLVGGDGRIRGRAGKSPLDSASLAAMLDRLLSGSGPRVELESYTVAGSLHVVGHPLRSSKDANLGALVIGSDERLTAAQNNVVSTAVGLLELLFRQRTSGSLAPSQLAVALLLHPETMTGGSGRQVTAAKDLLAQSLTSTRTASMRVVQGVNVDALDHAQRGSSDGPVRELLQWRRLFETKLVEITDYGFAAITRLRVDDALLAEVDKLGWRVVVGDPTELNDLPAAYKRATSLRSRVQSTQQNLRVDAVTWSVTGLLGPEAGSMLAGRLFAPLLGLDPERRETLLGILRAWLGENGSWDGAAKALGLHRNSVRRQIGVLAELLQYDINDAQTRAELWIGLQYADSLP
ncbi:PucR family transcriptional regulator [Paenarthrobacter sp. PH39-S1]|uniref:PucR family transcriptional regulator n=1 Tax=Paenarthrobacter sp. PH39-S1 TaxID=3046204 RepID=UPI0024BA2C4D|nr:PucR family transcriptional regulator [Paenarthrobacter sp. PH39-S1]MDJ0354701.1 PucR family transcriptional regulator [Paenarthrobacter sp. PH39-S1]